MLRRALRPSRPTSELVGPFDARDGVIETPDASARLIEVEAAGYELLAPADREAVDAALMSLVGALRFPVRWLVQSVPLDLGAERARLAEAGAAWPEALGAYAAELAGRLDAWERAPVLVRRRALLVWVDKREVAAPEARLQELGRRVDLVVERLARIGRGLSAQAVGTEDVLLWLYRTWYKDRALSTRLALRSAASGALELVVGVR